MKKIFLKITFGIIFSFWISACGQKQENVDSDENYTEETNEMEDEYTEEVLGIAKFNLSINGRNYKWEEEITTDIEESTGFSFGELPTDDQSANIYIVTLTPMKDAVSYGKGATLTLYSKSDLLSSHLENQFTVLHSAKDIQKCLDQPQSCAGIAFISSSDADKKDETHISESGKVSISSFKITKSDSRFIYGQMSGSFNYIGTNGKGNSNGKINGSFENALFKMLRY